MPFNLKSNIFYGLSGIKSNYLALLFIKLYDRTSLFIKNSQTFPNNLFWIVVSATSFASL